MAFPDLKIVSLDELAAQAQKVNEDARKLIAESKHKEAVQLLSDSAKHTGDTCGEDSLQMAELLFLYGKSLLQLSREDEPLFGGAIEDTVKKVLETVFAEMAGDEGDSEEEDEADDGDEGDEGDGDEGDGDEGDGDEGDEDNESGEEGAEKEKPAEGEVPEGEQGEGQVEDVDEEKAELAWQVLEVARLVLSKKRVEAKMEPKYLEILSEVHFCLGELALDAGMPEATEEFEACVEIRKDMGDSRLLAEAHYLVGLSLCNTDASLAISHIEKALSVLACCPQEDVGTLVEEVKERLEEVKEMLKEIQEQKEQEQKEQESAPKTVLAPPKASTTSTPVVHDFGVLGGGSKRKEAPTDKGRDAKKSKQ